MTLSIFELSTSLFLGMFIGVIIFTVYHMILNKKQIKATEKEAKRILHKAQSEALRIEKTAKLKSKDLQTSMKRDQEDVLAKEQRKIQSEHDRLVLRQSKLENEHNRTLEDLEERQQAVNSDKELLDQKKVHLEELKNLQKQKLDELDSRLEKLAQMTKKEAEVEIRNTIKKDLEISLSSQLKEQEERLQKESQEKSKYLLATALSRQASAVTTEQTTISVPIADEDGKGKIIGREGRNIRALEQACGVDILIEEGQDAVIISCFDSLRREVAKKSIERLIRDGRVNPARIEEVVKKVKNEINTSIKEDGEKACFELNVHDVHPEIIQTLGGLKYRTLQGSNALSMSKEVASLAGHIMAEIGGDEKKARRAALLHALGLNISHTVEGSYSEVGSQFAKKYREKEDIVQAISSHNASAEAQSVLDHVVQLAVNLHRSLPNQKKANVENFISRMKEVESIANSFSGVIRSFAIRSGKELRVLVDSSSVTDGQTVMLCSDIVKKLQRELGDSYQLRVSVIRESRIIEHAR